MATPRLGLVVEDKPTELSCSYLTSSSVLGGFITPADWVRLSLGMTRFFVPVSLLKPFFRLKPFIKNQQKMGGGSLGGVGASRLSFFS